MYWYNINTVFTEAATLSPTNRKSSIVIITLTFCRLESSNLVIETYLTTQSAVYNIEEDRYIPGHIIFADQHALKTSDGLSSHLIAGSVYQSGYVEGVGEVARFYDIHFFLQISPNQVLIADVNNHCLRILDRLTNKTETFSGNCTESGNVDGVSSLFRYPRTVIIDAKNPDYAFISEYFGYLKKISLLSRNVSTLWSGPKQCNSMVQEQTTGNIFLTFPGYIGLLTLPNTLNIVAGSPILY